LKYVSCKALKFLPKEWYFLTTILVTKRNS
jgi:hypothetical protein